jgi:hypothetical protein
MTIVAAAIAAMASTLTSAIPAHASAGLPAFVGILAAAVETEPSGGSLLVQHLIAVVVFAAIGIVVFALGILLFVKLCPFSVRKEIEEDQNTALAIIMGAVLLGLSLIIAAAIHG